MANDEAQMAAPFQAVIIQEGGVIRITETPTNRSTCLYEEYTELALDLKSPLEICSSVFRTARPQTVDIIANGSLHAPAVTIHLKEAVLSNMPALLPEANAAATNGGSHSPVPFNPPVPLWALASTALLQEGALDVEKFLEDPCTPPRFLSDTLQMAEFIRADQVLSRIQRWLDAHVQQLLQSVQQKTPAAGKSRRQAKGVKPEEGPAAKRRRADSMTDLSEVPLLRTEILKHIPVRFLYATLSKMKLQSVLRYNGSGLLSKWVEASSPCLDVTAESISTTDFKKILSCCREAGVTEIRTSGPHILQALKEGSSSSSSREPLGIVCLHLQISLLSNELADFSYALSPLACSLKSLVLGEFDLCLDELGSQIVATGIVWAFFQALSQLRHLKRLHIPMETWRKLIGRCPKVADVLRNLDGLQVLSTENESILGKVNGGAVTLMELPPPERLQALAIAAEASKFNIPPTPGTPSSDSRPCTEKAGASAPSENHAAAGNTSTPHPPPNHDHEPVERTRAALRLRSLSACTHTDVPTEVNES